MNEATRRLLGVLLRFIDGFQATDSIVIAATNRKHDLDAALLSRCDTIISFNLPDASCRAGILKHYAAHLQTSVRKPCFTCSQPGCLHGTAGHWSPCVCRSWSRWPRQRRASRRGTCGLSARSRSAAGSQPSSVANARRAPSLRWPPTSTRHAREKRLSGGPVRGANDLGTVFVLWSMCVTWRPQPWRPQPWRAPRREIHLVVCNCLAQHTN